MFYLSLNIFFSFLFSYFFVNISCSDRNGSQIENIGMKKMEKSNSGSDKNKDSGCGFHGCGITCNHVSVIISRSDSDSKVKFSSNAKYEGVLKSTDKNYNYVVSDTEEYINDQRGRYLGLVLFRGHCVLNVSIICKEKDIQKKEVDRFKN
ncbi:hypothetical protein CWI36_0664p0050 [Hamiltosporidium magnivora]|uniref:Sm domain-containing protein n=2 Tax=Hamiltosporidium magnivora TaxID=148818 RepID=A0A4Q9LC85_9MICR|nr:hypothetical protein CWI36_0664p0050 [Hamiltosporidium magnivora]